MSKQSPHIALLMMVKNEQKRLLVSLNSVLGNVDSIILYDTGSEDNTIEIASTFCQENNIPFRLKQGEFVDFSTSRNVSLEFADTFEDIDFILLMDTNDELRGGAEMRKFCTEQMNTPNTGYLLCQEWWSGQYVKYYNIRLLKARQGWKYFGKVHEWLKNTRFENDEECDVSGDTKIRAPDTFVLYQDRTADDDKSWNRFERDKILLLKEHEENPSDPRTVFYLAQTFSCLKESKEALHYYALRTEMLGFWEERFQAYLRCGELSEDISEPWETSFIWYMKAFEHTQRVEPLIKIIEHYKDKNWLLCFTFADLACKLTYPEHCVLFVDKQSYEYKRWHLLGIAGWYTGFLNEGKIGCQKAIECANLEIDINNLKFYQEKEIKDKQMMKDKLREKSKKK